jgi:chromate transporter
MNNDAAPNAPASPRELFLVFNRLALQGFGGVLAVAQRELVERQRWLTRPEFLELLSLGQVLPGPNIVNLSLMIGDRFFGLRGACAALAGMLVAPLAIVLALASLYTHFATVPEVAGALRGMGVVAAGLIVATAIKLAAPLRTNPLGRPLCALLVAVTAGMVAGLRWPLVGVVLGLGALAIALAWWRLRE